MFVAAWFIGNGIDGGETAKWLNDHMLMPPEGTAGRRPCCRR